ncbi:hypothetical protein PCANC_06518 [Puccinia coronata f. sp. avenae]|uniref:Uncharacterized protein n=1 Tax=Puccinia coronata f. sp. avenae TaxID=200324 RepID=A0A2N5T574_9BASI|nr:hypothetical protein PCANC_06032 [Puccinia coronata f. sp. avenae]PLW46973.1 hypothetical protein PCANC_06518 [Puccinia coronata f. sp. avenae]PLW47195.1 hypothetical protein PCASD_02364 [Puccinia coronata f. sp. avenae]
MDSEGEARRTEERDQEQDTEGGSRSSGAQEYDGDTHEATVQAPDDLTRTHEKNKKNKNKNKSGAFQSIGFAGAIVSKISQPLIPSPSPSPSDSNPPHPEDLLVHLHDIILDQTHAQLELFLTHLADVPLQCSTLINGYLNGYTSFHQACDMGDLNKVRILWHAGADPGLRDQADGLTGIQLAQEAGRTDVVQFLAGLPPPIQQQQSLTDCP